VDLWHCDAEGSYSATGQTYLRGAQVTNADGLAEFTTIYPGWYPGRTVHIHAKVHIDRQTVLTSQLFFDENVNSAVYKRDPYSQKTGRDVFNDNDGIFNEALVATAKPDGDGYLTLMTFDVEAA
jgi:protocatechuate 3,4-dioxygenase beta subunit